MKKILTVLLLTFIAILSVGAVSAWHCVDTDQVKPVKIQGLFGPWGDNELLGGNTTGWMQSNTAKPEGCSGTQGNYKCQDFCDGTTLKEFSCVDRTPTNESYQDCHWDKKEHKNICTTKWHMVSHTGETVISWFSHENSDECVPNTPEFGVVAGALALVGAIGIFVFTRKN